jgi:hypothetical protein
LTVWKIQYREDTGTLYFFKPLQFQPLSTKLHLSIITVIYYFIRMKKVNKSSKGKTASKVSSATRFAITSSRIEGIKPSRALRQKLAGSIKNNRKVS